MKICAECSGDMRSNSKHLACLACRSSRKCSGCETQISYHSKGKCRACANAELRARPGFMESQVAGIMRYNTDPRHAEVRKQRALKAVQTKMADPVQVAKMRELGRLYGAPNLAKPIPAEQRARAGRTRTETVLAWCPVEKRDRYLHLKKSKLLSAAEAKAVILDEIAVDERRRIAALSPFERQMERVRAGATLVDRFTASVAGPAYTLGGVSDMGA